MSHLVMINKLLIFQLFFNWSNMVKMLRVVPRYPINIGIGFLTKSLAILTKPI